MRSNSSRSVLVVSSAFYPENVPLAFLDISRYLGNVAPILVIVDKTKKHPSIHLILFLASFNFQAVSAFRLYFYFFIFLRNAQLRFSAVSNGFTCRSENLLS